MHHVVNKARRLRRYAPEYACERCQHFRTVCCDMGRPYWPKAGRRCEQFETKGRAVGSDSFEHGGAG